MRSTHAYSYIQFNRVTQWKQNNATVIVTSSPHSCCFKRYITPHLLFEITRFYLCGNIYVAIFLCMRKRIKDNKLKWQLKNMEVCKKQSCAIKRRKGKRKEKKRKRKIIFSPHRPLLKNVVCEISLPCLQPLTPLLPSLPPWWGLHWVGWNVRSWWCNRANDGRWVYLVSAIQLRKLE